MSDISLSPNGGSSLIAEEEVPTLSRRRAAPSETDPLADILAKLGLGDGGGSTVVAQSDAEGVILVMVEVLQIPRDQAQFFLESANNDVAVAVDLHFELIGDGNSGKRVRHDQTTAFQNFTSSVSSYSSIPNNGSARHRWQNRDVHIYGLPEGWSASVSSITGQIMFRHLESGILQNEVPPGFADIPKETDKEEESSAMASAEDNDDSDIPDLVSPSQPNTSPWSSPCPPTNNGTFNFAPRNNIFKSSSPFGSPTIKTTPPFASTSPSTTFTFGGTGSSFSASPTTSLQPPETDIGQKEQSNGTADSLEVDDEEL